MKTWMELAGPLALATMALALGAYTYSNLAF